MFDRLTNRLQAAFQRLRGAGTLTETNIAETLREVRLALLEADVHYATARDFLERVKAKSLGREVLQGISPGQQIIKIIHDEITALLGGQQKDFALYPPPAGIMLLGLHGSGKTTTAGKLARQWIRQGKKVLLVAADLRRPAAIEQLEILAKQTGAGFLRPPPGESVPEVGRRALHHARQNYFDVVIYDTGGRFQMDAELVEELRALRAAVEPRNVVLVADAALGQESVNVAQGFHAAVGLTGLILTKLDGDARGGAALSVVSVVGCPILRVGVGEHPEDLEPFYPERMAARILGMGDVVSLVEKVQENLDAAEAEKLQDKIQKRRKLDLNDFLAQLHQVQKMGSMSRLLELVPGASTIPAEARRHLETHSEAHLKRAEAIIRSMTPQERRHPEILDGRRKKRIARGSGQPVSAINELLKNFRQARDLMQNLPRLQKRLPRGRLFG